MVRFFMEGENTSTGEGQEEQDASAADIPAALAHLLTSKGYHFEDELQKNNRLWFAARDIRRYMASDTRDKIFLSEEERTVAFQGEPILVNPSFLVVDEVHRLVSVVKVKADTPKQSYTDDSGKSVAVDERENDESYALMLLARKYRDEHFPDYACRLEINHLSDEYVRPKRGETSVYIEDFFGADHSANTTEVIDGDYYDRFFQEKWAIEETYGITCSGAGCSGCGCYNACHYTEPPLIDDTSGLMKSPDDIRLSFDQRQVVNHNEGSILVDSGAGAGKTTCITLRLLELLRGGTDPGKICLLTFTNAAAKEMTDRVAMYVRAIQSDPEKAGQLPADLDINDITACTFNGLCQKVIEQYYEELGFDRVPQVIPNEMEQQMVHDVFNLYPEKIPGWNYNIASKSIYNKSTEAAFGKTAAGEFLALVEQVKLVPEGEYRWKCLEELHDSAGAPLAHKYIVQLKMMIEDFEAAHTAKLNGFNSSGRCYITYLDQFLLVEKLLTLHPTLWDEYGFEHIIVDEVQDSNTMQLKLLQHIQNNASYHSLCSVGDMQQSIYGFNGAVPENMLHENYETFFGPTTYASVRENFRCSREVIGFTNTVIDMTIDETEKKGIPVGENEYEHLIGTRGDCGPVHVNGYYSKKSQFADIAQQMKRDLEQGTMPGDIMFITRNKTELNAMASELTKLGIPSVLRCPVPYIENSNVGSAIAFMDSFLYGFDEGYFDYCNQLVHGELFGKDAEEILAAVDALREEVAGTPLDADTLKGYLNALDPDKKDECYQSFLSGFTAARDIPEIKQHLLAFKQHGSRSTFKREATYGEIQLSTIHSAKGLESRVLYADIGKLDTAKFHEPRLKGAIAKEFEETNRLEYVAYTRAKDKLVVTAPYVVKDNGGKPVLNKRLINCYRAAGKPYGYNFMAYMAEKAGSRSSAAEEALAGMNVAEYVMPTLDDVKRRCEDSLQGQATLEELFREPAPEAVLETAREVPEAVQPEADLDTELDIA